MSREPSQDQGHDFEKSGAGVGERGQDIAAVLRVLRKQARVAIAFAAAVIALAAVWLVRQPRVYRATVTVQVDLEMPKVLGSEVEPIEDVARGSYWGEKDYLATQYEIAASRKVAGRVVEVLGLEASEGLLRDAREATSGRPPTREQIVDALRGRLAVKPLKDTRLFTISADDTDPVQAQHIANAAADAYIEQNLERRLLATEQALRWLREQGQVLREHLEKSEGDLYRFKRDNEILTLSIEDKQNISAARVAALTEAMTKAQIRRIEIESRRQQLAAVELADPFAPPMDDVVKDGVLRKLKERYVEMHNQHAAMSIRFGEAHPQLLAIAKEMESVRGALTGGARQAIETFEAGVRAAREDEVRLGEALARAKEEAQALSRHEIRYKQLVREVENNEKLFGLVLGRSKEADLSRLLRVNNLRILDPAVAPLRPHRPRVALTLALALLVALAGGVGLAFVRESMDLSVKTPDELEELTRLPTLGIVPSIDVAIARARGGRRGSRESRQAAHHGLFVSEHPKSSVAECMRSIRTNLVFASAQGRQIRSLLVTSAGPRDGKTTVSSSLATTLAQSGARVLLVDTDLRRPQLHNEFRLSRRLGVSSVVIAQATLDEALQPTQVPNLTLLASGPSPPNPAEMLGTERFAELSRELARRFDWVVYDSPPIGAVTDASVLGRYADGAVVVVKSLVTRKDAVVRTVRQLREVGVHLLGTVLNGIGPHSGGYGYHYYYRNYGYYHGYYYGSDSGDTEEPAPAATGKDAEAS